MRGSSRVWASVGAWVGAAAVGCTGTIGMPGDVDPTTPVPLVCGVGVHGGPAPLRRLTRLEYDNTVGDLLSDTSRPARGFAPDNEVLGFDNNARALEVSRLLGEQYMEAAEALAATAITNTSALLGCNPSDVGEDACAATFIEQFGLRAWRRPLTAEEITAVTGLFQAGRAEGGFDSGVALVVQGLLQSPRFLYRIDAGDPSTRSANTLRLTNYEVASRLSYFLWRTMPDDSLFAAAASGELQTKEQVEARARQMLADGRARDVIVDFHSQWLDFSLALSVQKDPAVYPEMTDDLRAGMVDAAVAFVEGAFEEGDGRLETLLNGAFSYAGEDRAGILMQPAVLSVFARHNRSDPIRRGRLVRERFLCQPLPPPPANVELIPPEPDPSRTLREQLALHRTNPSCSGCHELMDPIGFGFEEFDGIGRYRTEEAGAPIDRSGEIHQAGELDGPFVGVSELEERLGTSELVQQCMGKQWFRYAFGREETDADACTVSAIEGAFARSGGDIRELIVAIATSDAFLFRTIEEEGVAP